MLTISSTLPEGAVLAPDEVQAPFREHWKDVHQIVERAEKDPTFRDEMTESPMEALRKAGLGAAVQALLSSTDAEVAGHCDGYSYGPYCYDGYPDSEYAYYIPEDPNCPPTSVG